MRIAEFLYRVSSFPSERTRIYRAKERFCERDKAVVRVAEFTRKQQISALLSGHPVLCMLVFPREYAERFSDLAVVGSSMHRGQGATTFRVVINRTGSGLGKEETKKKGGW